MDIAAPRAAEWEVIMENRPQGRDKNVTGDGKNIHKRGEGMHTGPVGQSSSQAGQRSKKDDSSDDEE
jgi:hypothetical protein